MATDVQQYNARVNKLLNSGSVVDYLNASGQSSDFGSRTQLAQQYGINDYRGTADQNSRLLNILRSGGANMTPMPQNQTRMPQAPQNQSRVPQQGLNYTPANMSVAPTRNTKPQVGQNTNQMSGGSIVDFLNQQGQASDFSSRKVLAEQMGISGYRGTADQNIQLLNALRSGSQPSQATAPQSGGMSSGALPQQGGQLVPTQDNNLTDLARLAGQAGLSVSDYLELAKNRVQPSQREMDEIAEELGITSLEASLFRKPDKTSQQLFDDAFEKAGLTDVKAKILAIDEEIAKVQSDLREALGVIDENPFLTEETRVGRGKRRLDQAEQTIGNLNSRKENLQEFYNSAVNEINNLVTRNRSDLETNRTIEEAHLNYLLKKSERKAEDLVRERILEGDDSLETFLRARLTESQPDLVGTSETGYYRWDPTLQKYVEEIPAGEGGNTTFKNKDTGETVDVTSVAGIKYLNETLGYSGSEIRAFLDENTDLNATTIDSLIEEAGITAGADSQFITRDWLIEKFGRDTLIQTMVDQSKKAEQGKGGKDYTSFWKSRDAELNEYLNDLMRTIEVQRQAGLSDNEILKEMTS